MPWIVFFAICSPRGMGEPHDIAPRGSGHLSYSAIWVADGAPLELLASLIHGVPLSEWRTDQGANQRAGGRCADRDDCRATPCVAASAIVEFQPVACPGRLRNGGPRCEQRRSEEQNEVGTQRGRPVRDAPNVPRPGHAAVKAWRPAFADRPPG